MMILHDRHGRFMEIEMTTKDGICWEHDFFELRSNEGDILGDNPFFEQIKEPYKSRWLNDGIIHFVDDVEYCLDQAHDCQNHEGDYADTEGECEVNDKIYEFNDIII